MQQPPPMQVSASQHGWPGAPQASHSPLQTVPASVQLWYANVHADPQQASFSAPQPPHEPGTGEPQTPPVEQVSPSATHTESEQQPPPWQFSKAQHG
jgi:hypothetical protein